MAVHAVPESQRRRPLSLRRDRRLRVGERERKRVQHGGISRSKRGKERPACHRRGEPDQAVVEGAHRHDKGRPALSWGRSEPVSTKSGGGGVEEAVGGRLKVVVPETGAPMPMTRCPCERPLKRRRPI